MSEREDYEDELREERYERKMAKRSAWEYAGPGWIRADHIPDAGEMVEEDDQ
jgi:hypothetical protein